MSIEGTFGRLAELAAAAASGTPALDPAADHFVTVIVRRPHPELCPYGVIQAFAGVVNRPGTVFLADGLLDERGVGHVLRRVRDFVETGVAEPPLE
ncbi:MAG TPA: hypothetical protein VNE67_17215 [Acetobacteraceae bacterium]|nr:hypothetical protein [Stellaceae bacterium]HVB69591.1 hypothetical protein [Acetobacteraceae bacterium]